MSYAFYYDETEHSQKISYDTITADNFYDCFTSVIVGWNADDELELQSSYLAFEDRYEGRKAQPTGEIKSRTIKQKQLKRGFASADDATISFIMDYLSLYSEKVHIYYSIMSKIEYIVWQFIKPANLRYGANPNAVKYALTKAIVSYQPKSVLSAMYNDSASLHKCIISFLKKRIDLDAANIALKKHEIEAYQQLLYALRHVEPIEKVEWEYLVPFDGFVKYVSEKKLADYSLVIDKEGTGKTILAAKRAGIINADEADSALCFGLRMADLLAGIISKLMKAVSKELHARSTYEVDRHVLNKDWFMLNDKQLMLYKKLLYVIRDLNNCWFKSYAGVYSDDFVSFIGLLEYMDRFSNADELQECIENHGDNLNGLLIQKLKDIYKQQGFVLNSI